MTEANGKVPPFLCAHPLATVRDHPTIPGKSICGACGQVGTLMEKTPGGVLIPKLEAGRG